MRLNKTFARAAAAVLTVCMMVSPASAMKLVGSGNIYSKLGVDSSISAGMSLSEADAAMRLYYLGILTGSGTGLNGGLEFHLERGLNRIEAVVFAVRLMGAEKEALEIQYEHPFTDVPGWASDYVGYIFNCGLIDDLFYESDDDLFQPTLGETPERFSSYMLYALGYRMEECDYTLPIAAEYARDIGICVTDKDAPMTRGDAVLAMYNTLRTTCKNSERMLSDVLVENGALSYQDAVFLLWNRNPEETEIYMDAVGYSTDWVIPDGYYKIRAAEGGKMLNVAMDGANNDYEGVPVTLWDDTDDITQTFRIERTERGTYYLYAAASRSGYGRVLGSPDYKETTGLYRETSRQAMEFSIEGMADGSWEIISAEDGSVLSASDFYQNGSSVVLAQNGANRVQSWVFEREGILNESGEEMAIFVAESLVVTQGAYDTYSHMRQNALDITPTENMVRAPFNATIVRIDATELACNGVWIQSNEKVRYADGTYDYMTVLFMHDNHIEDLRVGQGLAQGEYFYHCGDYGVSSGKHVHFACYRGQYHSGMRLGSGDVYAQDALFLPDDTYIYNDYGLDWMVLSLAD
ncbi:MAG: RICIN domain-containing protein [Clostridia bacterium]|nr:RICIN domain-containing protein [Clostridia bacterium]